MNDSFNNLSFFLPTGEDLRLLLSQEAVTPAVLRQMLRSRNVFCQSSEKKDLVPIFLLSYLTPDEFDDLLDIIKTREESPKIRSHTFEIPFEGASLNEALPHDLPFAEIADDPLGNYEIVGTPMFTSDPQGSLPSFVLEVTIKRTSVSSDLFKTIRQFHGSIRYTHNSKSKTLTVTTVHTSPETESVNRLLVSRTNRHLRDCNFITPHSEFKIVFGSFTNEQRMIFLMQFTGLNEAHDINFQRLTDLALKLDETKTIPDEERLNWMKKKVSKLRLNGEALEDTFFVTDTECRPFIICWRAEMAFEFSSTDMEGRFLAVLEFSDYSINGLPSAEFQISISQFSANGYHKGHPDLRQQKTRLIERLNNYKEQAFAASQRAEQILLAG